MVCATLANTHVFCEKQFHDVKNILWNIYSFLFLFFWVESTSTEEPEPETTATFQPTEQNEEEENNANNVITKKESEATVEVTKNSMKRTFATLQV